MACVYILLGTNLGNKSENLLLAKEKIQQSGIIINTESSVYETAPWGFKCIESFYNQVISIKTSIAPEELLSLFLQIENTMGRVRSSDTYEARIIDIDILFYNSEIIETEHLKVPHPMLHLRKFTLAPLYEIIPEFVHPVLKKNIRELYRECTDNESVKLLQ